MDGWISVVVLNHFVAVEGLLLEEWLFVAACLLLLLFHLRQLFLEAFLKLVQTLKAVLNYAQQV